jgi:hypothetical protein
MNLTEEHFLRLAAYIKEHQYTDTPFRPEQIEVLANFCDYFSSNFNRERWLDYLANQCGPRGGKIKREKL